MILFLGLVAAAVGMLWEPLKSAFMANQIFNGMILGVFALGVAINFRQILELWPEIRWVSVFRTNQDESKKLHAPNLLSAMAKLLGARRTERFTLSTTSMRTLLDGIRSRLDDARDLSRYMIGLLVFLGLLGTFWGLLETVASVGAVIGSLSMDGGMGSAVFEQLKQGLQAPLSGMGTAFSSSLFGLAGSLVLGFLDLRAGHAQNRFYNDVEEWLSELTQLSSGVMGASEGEGSIPGYLHALLEQTAESVDRLQRVLGKSEDERRSMNTSLMSLTEQLNQLNEQMRNEQKVLLHLSQRQSDLQPIMNQLSETMAQTRIENPAMVQHLRNVDASLIRMIEEQAEGRSAALEEMRNEIRLLARTMSHASPQR